MIVRLPRRDRATLDGLADASRRVRAESSPQSRLRRVRTLRQRAPSIERLLDAPAIPDHAPSTRGVIIPRTAPPEPTSDRQTCPPARPQRRQLGDEEVPRIDARQRMERLRDGQVARQEWRAPQDDGGRPDGGRYQLPKCRTWRRGTRRKANPSVRRPPERRPDRNVLTCIERDRPDVWRVVVRDDAGPAPMAAHDEVRGATQPVVVPGGSALHASHPTMLARHALR